MILKTSGLSYDFGSGKAIHFPDLQIRAGEKVVLVGASGSGKSTFLNLISGVLPIQSGSIELKGHPYDQLSGRQLDSLRADHIGIIFQSLNLIPYLSGFGNAQLGLQFSKKRQSRVDDVDQAITALAQKLGLTPELLHQQPSAMSIGQQQRITVIRAMLGCPDLILADEPTSALDPTATEQFMTQLNTSIDPDSQAVIVVSHNPEIIPLFDRVIRIGEDQ